MNEKFKLLALQAQMGTADFDAGSYYVATPDRMQLFAELIVKECASMAESFHHHQYDFTGNLELHEFIKTHFGVEA
jgi:hypothetical protein